jgi:farnesyl diphosphate synthase
MNPDRRAAEPWATWSKARQQRIEQVLASVLRGDPALPVWNAMRYAVLGGGKRIRPLLVYAAGEVTDAPLSAVDAAAAAVELIHGYSLVHDDLPCMDDDSLRRGKPTCHVAFGEAMALLAGDALQSLAFEVVASAPALPADFGCRTLAQASGAAGMAGGQAIDLDSVGKILDLTALEQMHRLKTGALIRAAVRLGAACGRELSARESAALDAYSSAAGLAFQVIDDVLDVAGSSSSLGKTTGKDAAQDKPTFVSLLGLDAARRRAEDLRQEALAALAPLDASSTRLAQLADWIVLRTH